MTIRNFFGFDDVPLPAGEQKSAALANNFFLPPLPFAFRLGTAAGSGGVTYTRDNGWLKCTGSVVASGTGVGKSNYIINTLQELGLSPYGASVFTIGLRWVCPVNVTLAANWPQPIAISISTVNLANQTIGAAFPFGDIPGWTAGKEYYLEAQYDVGAGVIRRRIDGVAIADKVLDNNVAGAIAGGTARFTMGQIGSAAIAGNIEYSFWFKDMYIIEKTGLGDGAAETFLGPQMVVPIAVASNDQSTWLPTGAADSVTALNAVVTDTASLATPLVTTDVVNNSANLGLSVPNFIGQVNGVALRAIARRKDGASGTLSAQVALGADNSATVSNTLTNTIVSGYKLYFAEKSPSGARWTRAALQAAKLKLTVS